MYHGVGKFDKVTGQAAKSSGKSLPAYTKVYGDTICELAEKDGRVVAITAAMPSGTGLVEFSEKYPDRFYDVGIAEAHAACFAAGLAADNIRPYLTIYSTFMQRAYDQVIHDMAIQKLPVTICMDRGGVVGNDGPTHHGVFDLSYFAPVPNCTVCAPKDGNELRAMMHQALEQQDKDPGVIAIRYPRDAVPTEMTEAPPTFEWGTWEELTPPSDIVILAVGAMVVQARQAAERLGEDSIDVTVVNARFVKPLDLDRLESYRENAKIIFTVEENQRRGGFGQAVADYLLDQGYDGDFKAIAIDDEFTVHGTRGELLRDLRLDDEGLYQTFSSFIDEKYSPGGILQKLRIRRNGGKKKETSEEIRLTGTDSK